MLKQEQKQENPPNLEKEQSLHWREQAEEVVGKGHYEDIINELKEIKVSPEKNLLELETEQVREKYKNVLEDKEFLGQKEWEMLTLLELYDPPTVKHSIRTLFLAEDKIELLENCGIALNKLFDSEISKEEFYRAALFHDVGKIIIPGFILKNSLDKNGWLEVFHKAFEDKKINFAKAKALGIEVNKDCSEAELLLAMEKNNKFPKHIIPIKEIVSSKELAELKKRGFTGENSFMEIVQKHEPESGRILRLYGFSDEAKVAEEHGISKTVKKEKTDSSTTLGSILNIAKVLEYSDVEQALNSSRYYKESFSQPEVLAKLVGYANEGGIEKGMVYIFVKDKFEKIGEDKIEDFKEMEGDDYQKVKTFLEENREFSEKWKEVYKK